MQNTGFESAVTKERLNMTILLFIIVGAAIIGVLGMAIKIGLKVLYLSIILAAIVFVISYLSRALGKM